PRVKNFTTSGKPLRTARANEGSTASKKIIIKMPVSRKGSKDLLSMTGKLQLFYIFLLFSPTLFAQLTGTVTDGDNEPLPYVNIYTADGTKGTTTNEEGDYELKINTPGTYDLVFQFLGFETL